jgi:hypothetical protein
VKNDESSLQRISMILYGVISTLTDVLSDLSFGLPDDD